MVGGKAVDQIKRRMLDKVRVIEEALMLDERADPKLLCTTQMSQVISSLIVSAWSS